jgi:uncharacterized integral membrane protein
LLFFFFTVGGGFLVVVLRNVQDAAGADAQAVSHAVTGVLIAIVLGILLALFLFLSSFHIGITRYARLIQRLPPVRAGVFSLQGVVFPEGDEYGNLGKHLNKLIAILSEFDALKGERLAAAEGAMRRLAERLPTPLLALGTNRRVLFVNGCWKEAFGIERSVDNYLLDAVLVSGGLAQLIDLALERKTIDKGEALDVVCQGRQFSCDVTPEPVAAGTGELLSLLLFFSEIRPAKPFPSQKNQ